MPYGLLAAFLRARRNKIALPAGFEPALWPLTTAQAGRTAAVLPEPLRVAAAACVGALVTPVGTPQRDVAKKKERPAIEGAQRVVGNPPTEA